MYATLRPAPAPPGTSFQALHLRVPAFGPHWHQHDLFELNHIVCGTGRRWVGATEEAFAPGDIVLVPPSLPHSWISDPPDGVPDEAVVALFDRTLLGDAPEWRAARDLLDDAGGGLAFADADGVLAALLRDLADLPAGARLLRLLDLLDRLAHAPRRAVSQPGVTAEAGPRDHDHVRQALAMLSDARDALPSAGAVAQALGLSPSRFSRIFRRATGTTFAAHVDALRITRACTLLQEGRLTIAQTCYAAGFGNLSNFNRRFRHATACTPRDYRRKFVAVMRGM